MKLWLLAVGQKMPAWVETGFTEYQRRLPREFALQLVEVRAEKRTAGKPVQQIMAAERDRILDALPTRSILWALDEHGEQPDSLQWADWLQTAQNEGDDLALVIGGADGLHAEIRQRARRTVSLSKLTLPHALVRVLVAEQVFRAVSILNNHPYHRE